MIVKPNQSELALFHAEVCGALADPTRIAILYELADGPRNVSQLVETLGVTQPTVSRHLKTLRERGMVQATRDGGFVAYTLLDRRIVEALDLLRAALGDILARRGRLAALIDEPASSHAEGG